MRGFALSFGKKAARNAANRAIRPTSPNQMQRQVERGQAPGSVDRVDLGNPSDPGDLEPHIEFTDGFSLRRDGLWKHDKEGRKLTKEEQEWITKNGWTLPRQ